MPLYRLRAGSAHYKRDLKAKQARKGLEKMKTGEEIELTLSQFSALRDKFELVGPSDAEKNAAKAMRDEAGEAGLELVRVEEDGNLCNVMNKETGEFINDEPLTWAEGKLLTEI